MGLCLVDIHGDIEGDYDYIKDLCNMTNGEVMQAAFPNNEFIRFPYGEYVMYEDESRQNIISFFSAKWWNAPYKEERCYR